MQCVTTRSVVTRIGLDNANPTGTVSYLAELDSFLDILSRVGQDLSPQTIAAKQLRATGWTIIRFFLSNIGVGQECQKRGWAGDRGQVSGVRWQGRGEQESRRPEEQPAW